MAGHGSKKVIYAALIGNGLIAITKFAAASITGSSAMLSEAIHSVVDTGNQGLLLYGIRKSNKPKDARHPFGYGMEIYFWAFVVAILIFAVGSGMSIYEGIHKLHNPGAITSPYINYIVLTAAMIFEGVAWYIAYKEFNKVRGKTGWIEAVRHSKDPTVFTVLFEDSAAMLGLMVAFIGVVFSAELGIPWADGAASIGIGIILAGAAIVLALETKGLLLGEAASAEVVSSIENILKTRQSILHVNELRTMHMGPYDILLALSVDFQDALNAGDVEQKVSDLEREIKSKHPEIKHLFIEMQSREAHLADAVSAIAEKAEAEAAQDPDDTKPPIRS